jgi:hypothetical protein
MQTINPHGWATRVALVSEHHATHRMRQRQNEKLRIGVKAYEDGAERGRSKKRNIMLATVLRKYGYVAWLKAKVSLQRFKKRRDDLAAHHRKVQASFLKRATT